MEREEGRVSLEWMDGSALRRIEGLMFVSLDFLSFDELEKRSKRKLRSLRRVFSFFDRQVVDAPLLSPVSLKERTAPPSSEPPPSSASVVNASSNRASKAGSRTSTGTDAFLFVVNSSPLSLCTLFWFSAFGIFARLSLILRTCFSFLPYTHPPSLCCLSPFFSSNSLPSSEPCFCSSRFTPHSHLLLPHTHTCLPLSLALRSIPCCLEQDLMLSLSLQYLVRIASERTSWRSTRKSTKLIYKR